MDTSKFMLGAIESEIDLRDYDYSMLTCISTPITIPKSYCLDYNYPILDQQTVGSCVAHSLSELKSYIDGTDLDNMYSRGFIYSNRSSTDSQGHGMVVRQALSHLINEGCCLYKSFPVNEEYPSIITTLNSYGKDKLFTEAKLHKSSAYLKINANEIKEYLVTQSKPVLIVVKVYDNFYDSLTNGGIIPSTHSDNLKGSHAMLVIGFDSDNLIIVNSWGENYGDKGKFYLDINSSIISELWVLEDIKNIKRPIGNNFKIGWDKDNITGKWIYSEDGETLAKDCWKQIKSVWYYFKDIYAVDGDWVQYKGKWNYLESNTCAMCIGWKNINSNWYYFGDNGDMYSDCYTPDGYFVDTNGIWNKSIPRKL